MSRNLSGCQVFNSADIPAAWDCDPLGNRIKLLYGSGLTKANRVPGSIDVYGSNGVVGTHNAALVSAPGILVGRKGTVGAIHYSRRPFWPIDTVYHVEKLRTDDRWKFLCVLLDYLNLRRLNAATGVPGLTRRDALAIRGAFPPPDEQQAIADVLDSVDAAIDRTRTAIDKARRLKRGLMQQAFSQVTETPTKLGRFVGDIRYGTSQASNDKRWGYPTLRIPNIIGGAVNLRDLSYVDAPAGDAARFSLEDGDLLIVRTNGNPSYIGRSAVFKAPTEENWLYASYLIRIRLSGGLVPRFVDEFFKTGLGRRELFRRVTTSAGNYNINTKSIKSIPIAIPDDEGTQSQIVKLADAANQRIRTLVRQLRGLARLKRGLMQDLLTGTVRVSIPMTVKSKAARAESEEAVA